VAAEEGALAKAAAQISTADYLAGVWLEGQGQTGDLWNRRILVAEVADLLEQVTVTSRPGSGSVPAVETYALLERQDAIDELVQLLRDVADVLDGCVKGPEPTASLLARGSRRNPATTPEGGKGPTRDPLERSVYRSLADQARDIATEFSWIAARSRSKAASPVGTTRGSHAPRHSSPPTSAAKSGPTAKRSWRPRSGQSTKATAAPATPSPAATPPKGLVTAATEGSDPAQRYRDSADKLRTRVDAFGKILGSLGTAAVTAAGLARISSIFPIPRGDVPLVVAVFGALAVGATVVVTLAVRLSKVAEPISLRSDLEELIESGEITGREIPAVKEVFRRTYVLNNAASLLAYETRGQRLQRIRGWIGDTNAAQVCTDRATEIVQDVDVTLARASVVVVRRRSTQAVSSATAYGLYGLFLAAIIVFALASGQLISHQSGEVATLKSCADAKAAVNAAASQTVTTTSGMTTTTVTTIVQGGDNTTLRGLPKICRP
jgi:hypothetical protein